MSFSVRLNINEQKCLLREEGLKGPHTLYVRAVKNWPQPAAPVNPVIPLDVVITVKMRTGAHWQVQNHQLPNNGLLLHVDCESIEVYPYYWNAQGLAPAYAVYEIEGGLEPGWSSLCPVSFTDHYSITMAAQYLPKAPFQADVRIATDPAVGVSSPAYELVPQYAREARVITDNIGALTILDITNAYGGVYGFEEFRKWRPLTPFAYKWHGGIGHAAYSAGTTPAITVVEFR